MAGAGQEHHGHSSLLGPVQPYVKWTHELDGWSVRTDPAVAEDSTLYLSVYTPDWPDPAGREKWRAATGWSIQRKLSLEPDGTVYVTGRTWTDSALVAVSPEGFVLWDFPYEGVPSGGHAISEDGTIYFVADIEEGGELLAVSPQGLLLWRLPFAGKESVPPVIDASGGLFLGTEGDGLYAIWPDGTVLWHFDPGDEQFMRPVISHDRTLYVSTRLSGWTVEQGWVYALGDDATSLAPR